MARKGLFGRLADTVREGVQRLFGQNNNTSRLAQEEARRAEQEASRQAREREARERETRERVQRAVERSEQMKRESEEAARRMNAERRAREEQQKREKALADYRDKLEPIISEANRRWELLESLGYSSAAISRAMEEVSRPYFSLDNATSEGEMIAEATRARVFLSDETSTVEGAKIYTAQLNAAEYRGQFGNQYHNWENKFKNFNISKIDEDVAKEVFRNYRKLEELRAADITGDGAYGSENLIIAMYDAQVRGMDSFEYGLDQLDAHYRKKTVEWQSRFSRANEVTSILGTMDSDSDFLNDRWF